MRTFPLSPHRSSNLSFAGLIALGLGLVGSLAVALFIAFESGLPAAIGGGCLKMMASAWDRLIFHFSRYPFAAGAVAFIAGSLLWASVRAGVSLARSWRLFSRGAPYNAGELKNLDQVLTADPSLRGGRYRIIDSLKPLVFTAGVFKPEVFVSKGLIEALSEEELRAVLLHELGHGKRWDPLRLLIVRTISDALWFLPFIRELAAGFLDAAEQAADEAAVQRLPDPLDLASAIVKVAKGGLAQDLQRATGLAGALSLEERVMRLLDPASPRRSGFAWRKAVVSLLIGGMIVGAMLAPSLALPRKSWDVMASMPQGVACAVPYQELDLDPLPRPPSTTRLSRPLRAR